MIPALRTLNVDAKEAHAVAEQVRPELLPCRKEAGGRGEDSEFEDDNRNGEG